MKRPFSSGVITLTTDFGHKGPFVAVMKGVILNRFPAASIVDFSHDIPAYWPPEAGFWIERAYRYFPTGTVHIAIVDPGVGTGRDILIAECDRHIFMAPDNGLLDSLLAHSDAAVFRLDLGAIRHLGLAQPSLTFHGRDIFAPIGAELAAGRLQADEIGERITRWTPGWLDDPEIGNDKVSGVIVTIDSFGNLISNIDGRLLESLLDPIVTIAGHSLALKPTYGAAKPGEYLALINSFGVLEVARAEGSAAQSLGTGRGAPVVVSAP